MSRYKQREDGQKLEVVDVNMNGCKAGMRSCTMGHACMGIQAEPTRSIVEDWRSRSLKWYVPIYKVNSKDFHTGEDMLYYTWLARGSGGVTDLRGGRGTP